MEEVCRSFHRRLISFLGFVPPWALQVSKFVSIPCACVGGEFSSRVACPCARCVGGFSARVLFATE